MSPRIDPQPWDQPKRPPLEGIYEENTELASAELWPTGGAGPEDVATGSDGSLYTGLEDGRIIKYPPGSNRPVELATTGGRPLGVEVDGDGSLVVCDPYRGLLRVTPEGTIDVLVDTFEGEKLIFTNNASVGSDGTIYFTDTSQRFRYDQYKLDLLEHSGTGRLFARHPDGNVELLLGGLQFANGVALETGEQSLLVSEMGAFRIHRVWLDGPRRGESEVLISNLPGFADNLTFVDGILWVAIVSLRDGLLDLLARQAWMRGLTARLPDALQPDPKRHGFVLGLDTSGNVVHNLQDSSGRVAITTGAVVHEGLLYVGSLSEPHVVVYQLES